MKLSARILAAVLGALLLLFPAGCAESAKGPLQYNPDGSVVLPEAGEEVAVMKVRGYGEIVIRLFPDEAPKAVENFTTHAREGYYDGLTFHRVIQNFMIQGGDPRGNGFGGQSIYGAPFEDEFNDELYNFTGALSMANSGPNTNGSQYFINEGSSTPISDEFFEQIIGYNKSTRGYGRESFDKEVRALYEKVGGNPLLDGAHTVFGQVVEGMDVVHAIAAVETYDDAETGQGDIPVDPVIVESVTLRPYEGK